MNFKKEQVELLEQNKPFIVLQNVKDKYPNISSQSVILSQIKKMYISDPKNRLQEYEETINFLIKNNPNVKELIDFEKKSPIIQDKIQKKIKNGKVVYSTDIDKLIETIPLFNEDIDKYIKLPSKDAKQLRRTQTSSLNDKHHNVKIIDGGKLMLDVLLFLESENYKEYIPALLLATGRRQNELSTGNLMKSKSGTYFAIFDGQSKTGLDIKRDSYDIPLLAPFNIVNKTWKKAKEYFSNLKNEDNLKTFKIKIRKISRYIKKNKIYQIEKLHEYRSIYSLICYQLFPTGNLSQMAYISTVLGETSINIASHYNSIKVENVKELWIPSSQIYNWKSYPDDSYTQQIIPNINKFIIEQNMNPIKNKISKTIIKRISGKSQNVVDRFYNININEIEKYNKSL